jgi:hypothetical protein
MCPNSKRGQSIFTLAICNIFMLCRGTLAKQEDGQGALQNCPGRCLALPNKSAQQFSPAQPTSFSPWVNILQGTIYPTA